MRVDFHGDAHVCVPEASFSDPGVYALAQEHRDVPKALVVADAERVLLLGKRLAIKRSATRRSQPALSGTPSRPLRRVSTLGRALRAIPDASVGR
jgi:hypothetical protein